MYAFDYVRPDSLEAALAALLNEDATVLAGGQTLLPTLKQRLAAPGTVVDIRHIKELRGIQAEAGTVTIGAGTPHDEVAGSDAVRGAIPALAALAGCIGDPQVRHLGTLGGSIANNDPASDYPAAVLGLGAVVVTSRREINAEEYFQGLFETALEPGELIKAVRFPGPEAAAYRKFDQPASRFALTGVFVARDLRRCPGRGHRCGRKRGLPPFRTGSRAGHLLQPRGGRGCGGFGRRADRRSAWFAGLPRQSHQGHGDARCRGLRLSRIYRDPARRRAGNPGGPDWSQTDGAVRASARHRRAPADDECRHGHDHPEAVPEDGEAHRSWRESVR